jgi:hypothetical protein
MNTLTIRYATAADDVALARLAQLDSSTVPAGPRLIAEADGQLIAAVSARDGRAEAVTLLRRRAGQLASTRREHRGLRALRVAH